MKPHFKMIRSSLPGNIHTIGKPSPLIYNADLMAFIFKHSDNNWKMSHEFIMLKVISITTRKIFQYLKVKLKYDAYYGNQCI